MNKYELATLLLSRGSLFVHLDPRHADVECPTWFKHQSHLVLEWGTHLAIPIRDLLVTAKGISGTLSFSRTPIWCFVPWKAVFALVGEDTRGMIWEENWPPGLVRPETVRVEEPAPRGVLRSVPECGSARGPARKGHLRLV